MRKVGLSRYSKVSRTAFGLQGKQRIAVLRCGGAILGEWPGWLADCLHRWLAGFLVFAIDLCSSSGSRCCSGSENRWQSLDICWRKWPCGHLICC